MPDFEADFGGNPRIQQRWLGGEYVVIDGKQFDVVMHGPDKIVCKEANTFCGKELVIEKGFFSGWKVRDKGFFE